jgi:hypothetical protein
MKAPSKFLAPRRPRGGPGPVLCLIAILAQLLALPLHERQIAALVSGGPARSPASTLPLGGHTEANCAVCVATSAAHTAAPAEYVTTLPADPLVRVERPRSAVVFPGDASHDLASDPRAPPHFS